MGMALKLAHASIFGQFPQEDAPFRGNRKNLDLLPTPATSHNGTIPPPTQACRLRLLFRRDEEHGRTPLQPCAAAALQLPLLWGARTGSLLDALPLQIRPMCCVRSSNYPVSRSVCVLSDFEVRQASLSLPVHMGSIQRLYSKLVIVHFK